MGNRKRAVVLLSGGLDSATTLAVAHAEGFEMFALSFDYGQRHKVELDASRRIADFYRIKKHLVMDINLRKIGGSALTSNLDVPKDRVQNTEDRGQSTEHRTQTNEHSTKSETEIPVTYVPARNTVFLSLALAWAETLKASDIFIGVNAIDFSGYPDCRPEYIRAFEVMANLATKVSVEGDIKFKVRTPLIELSKAELIKKGSELGVDYSLTWSCYDPQIPENRTQSADHRLQNLASRSLKKDQREQKYVPCGRCDSCVLRARGFKEAGLSDPLAADPGYSL
jgi:7-cyano-7-deazaguanine synthase